MLKLERIYTKPFDFNGKRVLVDRLWTRGISKSDARLDSWDKEIAPSTKLRDWFKHDNNKYLEFKKRYLAELDSNPATSDFVEKIKDYAQNSDIILLYGAKNTTHNNAVVLAEYLEDKLGLKIADNESDFIRFYYNDGESNTSKKLPNNIEWLQRHPDVKKRLAIECGGRYSHISYNGKNLKHEELFNLAVDKSIK